MGIDILHLSADEEEEKPLSADKRKVSIIGCKGVGKRTILASLPGSVISDAGDDESLMRLKNAEADNLNFVLMSSELIRKNPNQSRFLKGSVVVFVVTDSTFRTVADAGKTIKTISDFLKTPPKFVILANKKDQPKSMAIPAIANLLKLPENDIFEFIAISDGASDRLMGIMQQFLP